MDSRLELDKFKKVKEDKKSVTFRHPMGHEINLNKNSGLNVGQGVDAAPQKFAEGGDAEPEPNPTPSTDIPNPNPTESPPPPTDSGNNDSLGGFLSGIFGGGNNPTPEAPEAPPPTPENYPIAQGNAAPKNIAPVPTPDTAGYEQNLANVEKGIKGEAYARGQQGQQEAAAAQENIQNLKTTAEKYQNDRDWIQGEVKKATDEYAKGQIDAQQFPHMNNNIGTAIGLVLGGIGGGLTHQANPVQQYLQHQQELNIQAQTANMNNKKNLIGAYTQLFGNLTDAQNMVRAIDNNILASKFQEAAGKAQDPIQKNIALQQAAMYSNQTKPLIDQLAIRRQIIGQMQNNEVGQPGGTQAAVAARFLSPDPETNKAALAEVKQQQNINSLNSNAIQSFDRVAQMQTLGNRLGSPIQSQKRINAEWEPMLDKLTKNNEGRVTPITVDLMSSLKPGVSDDAQTIAEKREKLLNLLNSERSTPTLDSIGVRIPKNIGVARTNPNVAPGYQMAQR